MSMTLSSAQVSVQTFVRTIPAKVAGNMTELTVDGVSVCLVHRTFDGESDFFLRISSKRRSFSSFGHCLQSRSQCRYPLERCGSQRQSGALFVSSSGVGVGSNGGVGVEGLVECLFLFLLLLLLLLSLVRVKFEV